MDVFIPILLLVFGMVLLIKGADFFVDGASNIAKVLRIPTLIIGLTLVSIGTSAPEFAVSLNASINSENEISFGNIVGSNIFNTFVVIGVSAIITPLAVSKNVRKFDIPILLGIYGLLILFGFVSSPNIINLWESIIIFSLTIVYTVFLILREKKEHQHIEDEKEKEKKKPWWLNLIFVAVGLTGIIWGGDLVVDNAVILAEKLHISEEIIGLTIVAIGTSLPELVTSIVAARKGENDIAVGNAIGSNIFNIILILGFCSILAPAVVTDSSLLDVIIALFSGIVVFVFAFKSYKINRWQGIVMVSLYALYLTFLVLRELSIF